MEHTYIHLGIEPGTFITQEFISEAFSFPKCLLSFPHSTIRSPSPYVSHPHGCILNMAWLSWAVSVTINL